MRFNILYALILINSCAVNNNFKKLELEVNFTDSIMKSNEIILPGKIAVWRIQEDSFMVYLNSITSLAKIKIGRFGEVYYSGHSWLNTKDSFIASKYTRKNKGSIIKGELILTDINNKFLEYIFTTNEGEYAATPFLTRNDSLLLFTLSKRGNINENHLEGLMRSESIYIMDFHSKEVINKIENVGTIPNLKLNESPWLYNGSSFIYSLDYENSISSPKEINKVDREGIYIYNLFNNQKKLLIPNGNFGICSPIDSSFIFKLQQSVYVYNLKDNSKNVVYSAEDNETIKDIHWTPDGKYIYIASYKCHLSDILFDSFEKLIEVKTGNEIPFKKISHGFNSYSWK